MNESPTDQLREEHVLVLRVRRGRHAIPPKQDVVPGSVSLLERGECEGDVADAA